MNAASDGVDPHGPTPPEPGPYLSLRGRTVCVTGAASGIGRATAELFGRHGSVVVVTDRDADGASRVAEAIVRAGGTAWPHAVDVTNPAMLADLAARVGETHGALDVLVNNAGVGGFSRIDDPGFEMMWDTFLAVLLTGQQRAVRALLPLLRRSDVPRIVNVASTEALGGTSGNSAYAAAKAGIVGMTRSLAVELGPQAITVNCVCPGPVLTAMTEAVPDEQRAAYARRRTALGRYGTPEEIAHVVVSLAMPEASFVTGAVIPVDGGLVARNG